MCSTHQSESSLGLPCVWAPPWNHAALAYEDSGGLCGVPRPLQCELLGTPASSLLVSGARASWEAVLWHWMLV